MNYRVWLFITISLFIISIVVGWATPDGMAGLLAEDIAALEELAGMLASLPPAVTAVFIFLKNCVSLLLSFILSPVLCLVPLLSITTNGWIIGWLSSKVIEKESLGFLLAGLLPHGVIELPAFIIGEAAALSFGSFVLISLFKKEVRSLFWPRLKHNLRYLLIALGLLVPAALIETFITPLLMK